MIVTVDLPNKNYDITIEKGLLDRCGSWLTSIWDTNKKVAIITDGTVAEYYLDKVIHSLNKSGFKVVSKIVMSGESSKSIQIVDELITWLSTENISRTDGIVALGGGVVGDLAGFVASIYMRGIDYVQVPTSLLAQVDSSVGGKTAINMGGIKNLAGTFYQPAGVLIDPNTLLTLPNQRVSEGLAEIIKMAAILDGELWTKLANLNDIVDFLSNPTEIIGRCCELKSEVVVADEKERGQRVILNFGHTLAHGLESVLGEEKMTHGQAVAIGMYQISKLMAENHLSTDDFCLALSEMLIKFELTIDFPRFGIEQFINAIGNDKKNSGQSITLVYVKTIGQAEILTLPFSIAKSHLIKGMKSCAI